jgi:hypothetical protein
MTASAPMLRSLIAFRRIPMRVVLGTAAASALLGLGMIYLGQPLYLIALYVLLPWAPVMLFEGLWKIKHYHWMAIFGVVVLLQIGHVIEHIVQVGVLTFTDSTLVCPPPIDSAANALRAVDAGLRTRGEGPTGMSASVIIKPGPEGEALRNPAGVAISGPPACGIFGQLDLEIVHLVWELAGWIFLLMLLPQFPRNRWLWFSIGWATFHTFEHMFISYTFFLDPSYVYEGARQLWGTVADGNIVTAVPLGKEPAMLNFYDVAGKFGLMAKNGLFGAFFPALNPYLPERPYLHLYYNLLVTVPMFIAFLQEARNLHDGYLRKALPATTTQAMAAVTPALEYSRYQPGEIIVTEGELAQDYYIITSGEASVIQGTQPDPQRRLKAVEFFGEINLPCDGRWAVTVQALTSVEVIRMDHNTFNELVSRSALTHETVAELLQRSDLQPLAVE